MQFGLISLFQLAMVILNRTSLVVNRKRQIAPAFRQAINQGSGQNPIAYRVHPCAVDPKK